MKTLVTLALLVSATAAMAQWDYQTGFGDTRKTYTPQGSYVRTTVIVANNGPQAGPRYSVTLSVTRLDGTPVCNTGYAILPGLDKYKHSEPLQFEVFFAGDTPKPGLTPKKQMHQKFYLTADVSPYGADPSGDTNIPNNLSHKTIEVVGPGNGQPSCKKLMGSD